MYGPEDQFFNLFAELSRYLPFLPLIGGGKTKFQPVYVGDISKAVMQTLREDRKGKLFCLGGPDIVSFKEVYGLIFKYTKRSRMLVPLPFWLAKINAFFLLKQFGKGKKPQFQTLYLKCFQQLYQKFP